MLVLSEKSVFFYPVVTGPVPADSQLYWNAYYLALVRYF